MLTLRCYDSGEDMAVLHMHPQQLSAVSHWTIKRSCCVCGMALCILVRRQ